MRTIRPQLTPLLAGSEGASGSPLGPKDVVFGPPPEASPPLAARARLAPCAGESPVSSGQARGAGGRLILLVALATACGSTKSGGGGTLTDGGSDGQSADAGTVDTATADAGATDATVGVDSQSADAGTTASDGGSGAVDGASSGCGTITEMGTCEGDKLQFCSEGELVTDDCVASLKDLGAGTCLEISAQWGSECALKAGGNCLSEDEEGNEVWEFCAGEEAGCVDSPAGVLCKTDVLTCAAADAGTCKGDLGIWECEGGIPYAIDCKAWSGKCAVVDEEPVCNAIAAEGACDDAYLICADGLSCVGLTDDSYGTCTTK